MAMLRPVALSHNFSWVEPYLESPWGHAIGLLAPSFPAPTASDEEWRRFAAACLIGALIFAAAGVLAALAVLMGSCCCLGRWPLARPSAKPLVRLGLFTLALTAAGAFAYFLVGQQGVQTATDQLDRLVADVRLASKQGAELAALGLQLSQTLNATIAHCPKAVQQVLQSTQEQVEGYRAVMADYNADIKGIPDRLADGQSALQTFSRLGIFGLGVPLALVSLCCAAIVLIVCATRTTQGSGRCSSGYIRSLGPLLFVPSILVITCASAGEFSLGLGLGSFCKDADKNVLTYIKHFAGANHLGEVAYNTSAYYVKAEGSSPLLDQLAQANTTMLALSEQLKTYGDTVATQCKDEKAVQNMTAVVSSAQAPLEAWGRLLSPQNVYPYYQSMVHKDACATAVSGLAWLVVSQYIVGLFCLPWLVCKADKFFGQWVLWQASCATRRLVLATGSEVSV